jgi:hypothetical protein
MVKDAKAKTILSIKAMYGNNHKSMMNFRLYLDVRIKFKATSNPE